jgi:hypothetical protein
VPRVRIAKDLEARTFRTPPARFDPRRADEAALDRYGFPPRPKDGPLLDMWLAALSHKLEVVQTEFAPVGGDNPAAAALLAPDTDNLLGGAYVDVPQGHASWVASDWTVPSLYFPTNVQRDRDEDYDLEAWIAIHESVQGSEGSLWCGYIGHVSFSGGKTVSTYKPVWQWAPRQRVEIENFPLSAGDTVACVICMSPDSTNDARIYYHNKTAGRATAFYVSAGERIRAKRAGWYVRPSLVTPEGPVLPFFASIYFDACHAGTYDGLLMNPETPLFLEDLTTGQDVTVTSILSPTLLRVSHTVEA